MSDENTATVVESTSETETPKAVQGPKPNYLEAPAALAAQVRDAVQAAINDGSLKPEWRKTSKGLDVAVCTIGWKLGELTLDPASNRGTDNAYVVSHLTVLNPASPDDRRKPATSALATARQQRDDMAKELAAVRAQLAALLAKQ